MKRLANRYYCPLRDHPGSGLQHDSGNGRAPRQRCRGCGAELRTEQGLWGVFVWDQGGRYRERDAERLFSSEAAAQSRADLINQTPPENMVVRWLPKEMIKERTQA